MLDVFRSQKEAESATKAKSLIGKQCALIGSSVVRLEFNLVLGIPEVPIHDGASNDYQILWESLVTNHARKEGFTDQAWIFVILTHAWID